MDSVNTNLTSKYAPDDACVSIYKDANDLWIFGGAFLPACSREQRFLSPEIESTKFSPKTKVKISSA